MISRLLTTSLLIGHLTVEPEPELDPRPQAEPAISIVDALFLEVSEQTVTTSEPMVAEAAEDAREPDPESRALP
jgi:hypothetical protein